MRPVKYHNKIKLLYWPPCWCPGSRSGPSKIKEIYFLGKKKKKNQVCMPGLVISYKDIPTPSLPLMILSFFSHIWLRCQQFLSHPDGLCVFRCVSTRKGTVVFHLPFWRRPFSPHRAGLYALAQYLKKYHSKQQHQKIIFFRYFHQTSLICSACVDPHAICMFLFTVLFVVVLTS